MDRPALHYSVYNGVFAMSRFLRKLHLRNLLSFDDCEVELRDLNILIGPNGAGKSNLIEAIGLLRSLVYEYQAFLQQGGGPSAWIWKGRQDKSAHIESVLDGEQFGDLVHSFRIDAGSGGLRWEKLHLAETATDVFVREGDQLTLNGQRREFVHSEPVFRHHKSPPDSGPPPDTGQRLESIRIYREFRTGKSDLIRSGYRGGSDGARLDEDGQNLGRVLHERDVLERFESLGSYLGDLNGGYRKLKPRFVDGGWYVQMSEEGLLDPIPAQRLSGGTLKFICLAALLLDPQPPPLICIEEPEVGLHPEAMRIVARLLREASERTQLVVTTHSVDLVNEFSATPEAVMVTEKDASHATRFTRLDRETLDAWLERYQLGELWQKGEIGGNRW